MAKRQTVALNLPFVNQRIKEKCRSNVVFAEAMHRQSQPTWVSDWNRKPKPKNLPSPEEAARMCVILETTPEEILMEADDIALVQSLLDKERQTEKAPAPEGESFTKDDIKKLLASLSTDQLLDWMQAITEELQRRK